MAALNTDYSELRKQRDALLQKRDEANAILEKARGEFEEARCRCESADREQSGSENRILFLERELQASEQKVDQLRSEQTVLAQQIQTADERIANLEEELTSERTALEAQQNQQLEIQAAHEKATKSEGEATEQVNRLRLVLATERQRYENLIAQRKPMTAREVELVETIAARQAMEFSQVPPLCSASANGHHYDLSASCRKELEEAEGKVEILLKQNGKVQAEPFER